MLQEFPKGIVLHAERVVEDRCDVVLSAQRVLVYWNRNPVQETSAGQQVRVSDFKQKPKKLTISKQGFYVTLGLWSPGHWAVLVFLAAACKMAA